MKTKIRIRTVRINGVSKTTFNGFASLDLALRALYNTQGDFYKFEFNVSEEVAEEAGWIPQSKCFNHLCKGWRKFIREKGKISRVMSERDMSLDDLFGKIEKSWKWH